MKYETWTKNEVAPIYGRIFEFQNQLVYLMLSIEKVPMRNRNQLGECWRNAERVLKLIREDW